MRRHLASSYSRNHQFTREHLIHVSHIPQQPRLLPVGQTTVRTCFEVNSPQPRQQTSPVRYTHGYGNLIARAGFEVTFLPDIPNKTRPNGQVNAALVIRGTYTTRIVGPFRPVEYSTQQVARLLLHVGCSTLECQFSFPSISTTLIVLGLQPNLAPVG